MTAEVHIAIYDLSRGMARNLSAQFLGENHAIEIIPHTAIVAFGKEYWFGSGIEWGHPHEFRMTRGIQPIEVQSLGHTSCTQSEFEAWCRVQSQNGRFSVESYDLLRRNCNNFTDEAANFLRLGKGVPSWILQVPQRFLSSPMGTMLRPMLEQMQLTNNAPTNISSPSGQLSNVQSYSSPTTPSNAPPFNPWADIKETSPAPPNESTTSSETPLLNKQTALLSTDTGTVRICIDRLKPLQNQVEILSKLENVNYGWTQAELDSIHKLLRKIMNESEQVSFVLMLLRLVVLRESSHDNANNEEYSQSTEVVADMLIQNKCTSLSTRSMAWCVLSNAFGSKKLPSWTSSEGNNNSEKFLQLIDRAINDCDPSAHEKLRQSATGFLYNTARITTDTNAQHSASDGSSELSEATMSLLIGCLENLSEESDSIAVTRRYMTLGQILISKEFGKTASSLIRDLGLADANMIRNMSHNVEVKNLAEEVASLM